MEPLNHESLMIASVVSGVVAGHRLTTRALVMFVSFWVSILVAVSPVAFAFYGWTTILVASCAFALAVILGRVRFTSLFKSK